MKQESNVAAFPWRTLAVLFVGAAVLSVCGDLNLRAQTQPACTGTECVTAGPTTASNPIAAPVDANGPMTAAQGAAILRELQSIHLLLENGAAPGMAARRPPVPQPVRMRVEPGWYELGRADAPLAIVEFTDLQCPVCRRFATTTFADIKKNFIDTGKVRFMARDLALPMHPYALGAAEAARCAGDQGKFWQFQEAVLNDGAPPAPDVLLKHATDQGLNLQSFQACLNDGRYKQSIQATGEDEAALGIHGTPGFVIGRARGEFIEGLAIQGARPFAFFQQQIEAMLNGSPSGAAGGHPAAGSQ
ncbi:MAG: thioredoxin domain-containing protein [Terriglobia bacterium]